MSLKRLALDSVKKMIRAAALARGYHTVPWVVHWEITHVCNLRCRYCLVPRSKTHGNTQKGLRHILEMKPKHVILSGGEPLLVPNIVEVAKTIREEISPYLMITTNLMVSTQTIADIIPYVDQLHFSIDGLGDYNKVNRGVSGEKVLEKIRAFMPAVRPLDRECSVVALCVLTPDNWTNALDLQRSIHAIDPGIWVTFATVEPVDSPLSLVQHPEIVKQLLPSLLSLREKHHVNIVGLLGERVLKADPAQGPVEAKAATYYCPRQFFRVKIDPEGECRLCKPDMYIDYWLRRAKSAAKRGDFYSALKHFGDLLDTLFIHPYRTDCPFPCKCEEFVDEILMSAEGEPLPERMFLIKGRFPDSELEDAKKFVCRSFNRRWNPLVWEDLAKRK